MAHIFTVLFITHSTPTLHSGLHCSSFTTAFLFLNIQGEKEMYCSVMLYFTVDHITHYYTLMKIINKNYGAFTSCRNYRKGSELYKACKTK